MYVNFIVIQLVRGEGGFGRGIGVRSTNVK